MTPEEIALFLLGLSIHVAGTLGEQSAQAGRIVWPGEWFKAHPYKTFVAMASGVAVVLLLGEINQLSGITAFFAGYSTDSMIAKIGNISASLRSPER